MEKAALHGLKFRSGFEMDPSNPESEIADSYANFTPWWLRPVSKRFHRPVGPPLDVGAKNTTTRINETIDATVFERWQGNTGYRPPGLKAWADRLGLDPALVVESARASDGTRIDGSPRSRPVTVP